MIVHCCKCGVSSEHIRVNIESGSDEGLICDLCFDVELADLAKKVGTQIEYFPHRPEGFDSATVGVFH